MRRAVGMLVLMTIAGCAIGPDFERPATRDHPDWREPVSEGESIANLPWWEVFRDPVLETLVHAALDENQDVGIAAARVEEAAAALGFTRADQFPSFRYEGSATRARQSEAIEGVPGGTANEYRIAATVFWEFDIWGRLRRSTESARAQLLATEAAEHGVVISLVASVAQLYFVLRDLDARLAIAERTLDSRRSSTELIRTRFKGGVVGELDVHQAEVEEATAAAAVPTFAREITRVESALAVLLGRAPGDIPRGDPLDASHLPNMVPAGLPSELLTRRPDIVETEALAHAQMARIGIAEALRLPTLSLTGADGLASSDVDDLTSGDANFWSIGADVFGPIFEFGKNKRRVEIEIARTQQAVLSYESTVLNAYGEVETSLAAVRTYALEYQARAPR